MFISTPRVVGVLFATASACAAAAEPVIVAGVEAPQPGLICAEAADQTRVHFHFNAAAADFIRMTIYVDGNAANPQDVEQAWPTVTLETGLHPGRNDVEIVATRADGVRVSRRMPVTIADEAAGDGAFVPCGGSTVVVEQEPGVIYEEPAYSSVHRAQVIYEDAPSYVYESYSDYPGYAPVAPLISFDVFSSRYHPWHHGYGGSYRHDHDERSPDYHHGGSNGEWHEHDQGHHDHHDQDQQHHERGPDTSAQPHGHFGPYFHPDSPHSGGGTESGGAHHAHGGSDGGSSGSNTPAPREQGNHGIDGQHPSHSDHPRFGGMARGENPQRERAQ